MNNRHHPTMLMTSMTSSAAAIISSLRANRLVLSCAARSFRYASSNSSYASLLPDATSLGASRSGFNSDALRSNPRHSPHASAA